MLNRRTFLGAAVAATILPAGDALADPAPSGRTFGAHETPEGMLYTVQDGKRRTVVAARSGPHNNYGAEPSEHLPPAFIMISHAFDPVGQPDAYTRRILPAPLPDGRVANSFSRPPSLEDVVAFHEACCADVPRRVIDASDHPGGPLYKVRDSQRWTEALCACSLNPSNNPVFYVWSFSERSSNSRKLHDGEFDRPSLSEVLAFHERCIAEDGAAAPRG